MLKLSCFLAGFKMGFLVKLWQVRVRSVACIRTYLKTKLFYSLFQNFKLYSFHSEQHRKGKNTDRRNWTYILKTIWSSALKATFSRHDGDDLLRQIWTQYGEKIDNISSTPFAERTEVSKYDACMTREVISSHITCPRVIKESAKRLWV